MQHILAVGDSGDMKHRVHMHGAVIADELAVRAFGLHIAMFVQIALDDHFGIGRNAAVVGNGFDQGQGFTPEGAHHGQFVGGDAHARRQIIDRVGADGEIDGQFLSPLDAGQVNFLQIRWRRQVGTGLMWPA